MLYYARAFRDLVMTSSHRLSVWFSNTLIFALVLAWLSMIGMQIDDAVSGRHLNMGIYVSHLADGRLVIDAFRTGELTYNELRTGDVVLQVGDLAKVPTSQYAFRSAFLNAQGHLRVLRAGVETQIVSPLEPRLPVAYSLVKASIIGVIGLLVAFFAKPQHGTRRPAIFLLLLASWFGNTPNGPTGTTVLFSALMLGFTVGFFYPVAINWIQRFADPKASWRRLAWPWVFSIVGVVAFSWLTGIPVRPPLAVWLTISATLLAVVTTLAMCLRCHGRLEPIKRSQLNWVISGLAVSTIIVLGGAILSTVFVDVISTQAGILGSLCFAIALGMAILKSDFGNIDHGVSVTVTYALIVVLLALLIEFVAEPISGIASAQLGLPEATGQTILVVLVALGAPLLKKWIQPKVESYFTHDPKEAAD